VHALHTAGHAPVTGSSLVDIDLCREGLRLARLLHELLPDEAMPAAVLALILLTEARRPARIDAEGDVVLLSVQDRTRWDQAMIAEGRQLLAESLRRTEGIADPYQLQAAVAVEHDRAADYPSTDWAEVIRLYDLLVSVAPSGPARLSRAVAVAERDGPDAGLRALEGLGSDPRVAAVRSELLARSGRYADAVVAGQAALDGEITEPERRFRSRRLAEWTAAASAPAVTDGLVQ
jgi:predicted RNA polymerase sigma factor